MDISVKTSFIRWLMQGVFYLYFGGANIKRGHSFFSAKMSPKMGVPFLTFNIKEKTWFTD